MVQKYWREGENALMNKSDEEIKKIMKEFWNATIDDIKMDIFKVMIILNV